MTGNTGDVTFSKAQGTGEHTCSFECFDTIGRLICCYCGVLAFPEVLGEQGRPDVKEGRYRVINNQLFIIDAGSPPLGKE